MKKQMTFTAALSTVLKNHDQYEVADIFGDQSDDNDIEIAEDIIVSVSENDELKSEQSLNILLKGYTPYGLAGIIGNQSCADDIEKATHIIELIKSNI